MNPTNDRPLAPYAMRTCGGCLHWFPVENPSLEIQVVKTGQCRRSPPAAQIINAQQNCSLYPHIPANFGACGEFESIVSVGINRLENYVDED